MGSKELISQLRNRVSDARYSVSAFSLIALDPMATNVELAVDNGRLRTEVENGSASAVQLNIDLSSPLYDTLEKLVAYIATFPKQYQVTQLDGMVAEHPSVDLEPCVFQEVTRHPVVLRTHRWSDADLLGFLTSGIRRHNPSYSIDSLPIGEHDLVVRLAHVELLRVLATDASRRTGLSGNVQDYLSLAADIETAYNADVRRLAKALIPLRTDDDALHDGDVVVGTFARASLRSGTQSPGPANLPPAAPLLYTPDPEDITDFSVVVRWRRTSEQDVLRLELWRDTTSDVTRTRDGNIYVSSSMCVWRSTDNQRDQIGIGTVDMAGELTSAYHDGFLVPPVGRPFSPSTEDVLLPGTTYWWRLYIIDKNGEHAASDAVHAMTKAERALFTRDPLIDALSVQEGPRAGGTVITIRGTELTSVARVLIGGVAATITPVSSTEITVTTAAVHRFTGELQDVTLVSSNGLKDVYPRGWRYTS